jgi:orotidine-5'-phosphate decarboxylase
MATVHCLGGRTMLAAAAQAAGADLALVGVTVLTSHDAADLEAVLGRGVPDLGFEAERLARTALDAGLRGVVASGHELALLREALGPEPWIVVPGIRLPGDAAGDQARTMAPDEAVRRGATHLVVGRPITASPDPVAAYRRLTEAVVSGV